MNTESVAAELNALFDLVPEDRTITLLPQPSSTVVYMTRDPPSDTEVISWYKNSKPVEGTITMVYASKRYKTASVIIEVPDHPRVIMHVAGRAMSGGKSLYQRRNIVCTGDPDAFYEFQADAEIPVTLVPYIFENASQVMRTDQL